MQEGFDLALRGGKRPDSSSLIVRKISTSRRILVASPTYLDRAGRPAAVNDLADHECVLFPAWVEQGAWRLNCDGAQTTVAVRGRVTSNDVTAILNATVAGYGIAQLFDTQCEARLAAGALEEVLPGSCLRGDTLWAVYPSRRYLSPAVRAFVDHAAEHLPRLLSDGV